MNRQQSQQRWADHIGCQIWNDRPVRREYRPERRVVRTGGQQHETRQVVWIVEQRRHVGDQQRSEQRGGQQRHARPPCAAPAHDRTSRKNAVIKADGPDEHVIVRIIRRLPCPESWIAEGTASVDLRATLVGHGVRPERGCMIAAAKEVPGLPAKPFPLVSHGARHAHHRRGDIDAGPVRRRRRGCENASQCQGPRHLPQSLSCGWRFLHCVRWVAIDGRLLL